MISLIILIIVLLAFFILGANMIYHAYHYNDKLLSPPPKYLDYWIRKIYAYYGKEGLKYFYYLLGFGFLVISGLIIKLIFEAF